MEIIPAIDVLDGRCAQLVGGKLGTEEYYGSPVEVARRWVDEGAGILHIVDLNATLGRGSNTTTVLDIRKAVDVPLQVGGGIRSHEDAARYLDNGINRIILGTAAVRDYADGTDDVGALSRQYGPDKIIVSVDSRGGYVVFRGWQEASKIRTKKMVEHFQDSVWGFLYTDVSVEGRMIGINLGGIRDVVKSTKKPVIVSGGVSSGSDVEEIAECGAWGVVLGKALYEGKIRLQDL